MATQADTDDAMRALLHRLREQAEQQRQEREQAGQKAYREITKRERERRGPKNS